MVTKAELNDFFDNNSKILYLPIKVKSSNDIMTELEKKWSEYLQVITKTDWLSKSVPKITNHIENIKKAVKYYYQGEMIEANKCICNILNRIQETKLCKKIGDFFIDFESKQWFRARIGKYSPYTKFDMGHIPANMRYKISNQRYSINGIPCLYLGNSIVDCWEELRRPSLEELWVCRFKPKNDVDIKVLNLSITEYQICYYKPYYEDEEFINDFFELWILQSACSVVVEEENRIFKAEYVIPQLIMQNLKSVGIDGVMYLSARMNRAYTHSCGWISKNLALPAYDCDNESPYSKYLQNAFDVSEPLNIGLFKDKLCYSTTSEYIVDNNWDRVHPDIYYSYNMKQPYCDTTFFKCEIELLQPKYGLTK